MWPVSQFILVINHIRSITTTLAIVAILVSPIDVNAKTWRNNPQPSAFPQRENTQAAPAAFYFVQPSLPTVIDKPKPAPRQRQKTAPQRRVVVSSAKYPRVARIVGRGGQCVTVPQRRGYSIRAGAARNWPSAARRLGYVVNRTPQQGAVLVTRESAAGHVLIQTGPAVGSWIPIIESNYVGLTVTTGWINLSQVVAIIHPKS